MANKSKKAAAKTQHLHTVKRVLLLQIYVPYLMFMLCVLNRRKKNKMKKDERNK